MDAGSVWVTSGLWVCVLWQSSLRGRPGHGRGRQVSHTASISSSFLSQSYGSNDKAGFDCFDEPVDPIDPAHMPEGSDKKVCEDVPT